MNQRDQRRRAMRHTIKGTDKRPRLVVFRSNKYLHAQLIDDAKGNTLASVNKSTDAVVAGKEMAKKALDVKIKEIVFDRAGYRYHGNIKKFADAAREGGLKF